MHWINGSKSIDIPGEAILDVIVTYFKSVTTYIQIQGEALKLPASRELKNVMENQVCRLM
jgi:hypothetical protein